jgi:hypothetical protein
MKTQALTFLLLGCPADPKPAPTDSDLTDTPPADTDSEAGTDTPSDTSDIPPVDTALVPLTFEPDKKVVMSTFSGCAIHPAYGVQCWGSLRPDPPFNFPWSPFADTISTAPFGLAASNITTGEYRAMAIDAQGNLHCWPGECQERFQGPDPRDIDVYSGGCVLDASGTHIGCMFGQWDGGEWVAIAEGGFDVCALRSDGTIDYFGRTESPRGYLDDDLRFVRIDNSGQALCGLTTTGEIHCAEASSTCLTRNRPLTADWQDISVGIREVCAINSTGHITCWGGNAGCIPVDWIADTPMTGRWISVATGGYTACAMKPSGKVRCWGSNRFHAADGPEVQIR